MVPNPPVQPGGDDGDGEGAARGGRESVRRALTERVARARKQAGAAEEAALRLGDDCELDVGDAGSRRTAVEEERRRADEARSAVQRAEAALRRLDEGAFGRCVSCGAAVGPERLAALPHTELCAPCSGAGGRGLPRGAAQQDPTGARSRRGRSGRTVEGEARRAPEPGGTSMSDTTPGQAEGERDEEEPGREAREQPARTTPSQAEGDRDDEAEDG
ncbi:hypothetical protein Sgou_16450 [Streptomyces gougerotii]|uniref:Zinc finger DksA/TraR C4-type domain-containing protein n=1 Tax=Streptomyces gougerotii TaxID=53448 RepID=A0A8H9HHZ5_9ACTN|nr:hypothetical protein Srut_00170 [Streptomyces rutgersensis]GFH76975.1 hypothetical protein Sgou_16450 [Streptomyces gougerotii]GGU66151.1 hypothetical protein GCM10010227_19760 [Streptomyces gougerotii]